MSWDTWLQCMSIGIQQNTSIFIDADKFWLRCRYAVIICALASTSLDMDRWFIYQIDKDSRKYIPWERRLLSPFLCIKQMCSVWAHMKNKEKGKDLLNRGHPILSKEPIYALYAYAKWFILIYTDMPFASLRIEQQSKALTGRTRHTEIQLGNISVCQSNAIHIQVS